MSNLSQRETTRDLVGLAIAGVEEEEEEEEEAEEAEEAAGRVEEGLGVVGTVAAGRDRVGASGPWAISKEAAVSLQSMDRRSR